MVGLTGLFVLREMVTQPVGDLAVSFGLGWYNGWAFGPQDSMLSGQPVITTA